MNDYIESLNKIKQAYREALKGIAQEARMDKTLLMGDFLKLQRKIEKSIDYTVEQE